MLESDVAELNCFALNYVDEKSHVFLMHTINAYRGSGGIAQLILNLGTTWK